MTHRWIATAVAAGLLWVQTQAEGAASKRLPQPDHVVMVIFENHSLDQIIDSSRAPFIYSLAANGALFVNAFAVSHPGQPNYFALFSGSTQGVRDNEDHIFDAPNLAGALDDSNQSFLGYVESGSPREHKPWESFNNAQKAERNLTELPSDFMQLPTVAFVIPNLNHDMHEGSVRDGDTWFKDHIGAYAEWAKAHNSLLIVTFDEDDYHTGNHIPTIISGAQYALACEKASIHYSNRGFCSCVRADLDRKSSSVEDLFTRREERQHHTITSTKQNDVSTVGRQAHRFENANAKPS